jgi:HD-like signal output (HDOD) protein
MAGDDKRVVIAIVEGRKLRGRALDSLGKLPPFSPILNRLLAGLAREDISFIRLADIIEKDTVLAGNVLRLVNSALYGRRATVNSVRHAVSLLGINKLRNATLSMSVTRLWNQVRMPRGWSMAKFNLHSVANAMLSDAVSQAAPVEYAEGAFAAGLFADLGRLLIALALPDEHEQIRGLCTSKRFSRCECEMEVFGFTHAELSADALEIWNLPEEIREAVLHHHTLYDEPLEDNAIRLSTVVGVTDLYVNAVGYPMDKLDEGPVDAAIGQLEMFGLGERLGAVIEEFLVEFNGIRAMF